MGVQKRLWGRPRRRRGAGLCSIVFLAALCARFAEQAYTDEGENDFGDGAVELGGGGRGKACRSDIAELSEVASQPALHSDPAGRPKTIMVVGMGGGTLCSRASHDWRSDLPRYLGAYANATVMVHYRNNRCRYCWRADEPHSPDSHDKPREGGPTCEQRTQRGVDLVMVVGSGKVYRSGQCGVSDPQCAQRYHDLMRLMLKPWARDAKRIVHFPIRALPQLTENKVFNFDGIIDDNSFPKPVSRCAVDMLRSCDPKTKRNEIFYIGRLAPHKGQLDFLQKVNPELMRGYKLRLFGRPDNSTYLKELRLFAAAKDIDVSINSAVSKSRLFRQLCSAKGLVIVSEDKNPRAVYEAVTSGLPVLVGREAQVSGALLGHPWFVETSVNRTAEGLNDDFSAFMRAVETPNVGREIREWVDGNLSNKAIYLGLCQRMGACRPDDGNSFQSAKDEARERWRRTWRAGSLAPTKQHGAGRWRRATSGGSGLRPTVGARMRLHVGRTAGHPARILRGRPM